MADVITCLSSLAALVFLREDLATCSPLITYSVKTLFSDTRTEIRTLAFTDAQLHTYT